MKKSKNPKEIFKPPFKAYLYQCDCGNNPDKIGYLFETLEEARAGACEQSLIQRVEIVPIKIKLPKKK